MLCPVCKSECGNDTACAKCGFDQLQVEFLSRDEATHWMNTVVVPYREKWQASQTATAVDWKDVLLRQKEVRYFFDVTIPAAESKNEVFGHTLLICPYKRLRDCFIEQLELQLPYRNIKKETVVQKMTMGEFAAAVSSLQPGDIYSLDPKALPVGRQYADDIVAAFKEFVIIVHIGKGAGARVVRLDLPPFTWLATVDKPADVPDRFRSVFENVIEIKADGQEMCKLEVASVASELNMSIHQNAIDLIASTTNYGVGEAVNCVKRISDYMLVKGIKEITVTEEIAKEIISRFM